MAAGCIVVYNKVFCGHTAEVSVKTRGSKVRKDDIDESSVLNPFFKAK